MCTNRAWRCYDCLKSSLSSQSVHLTLAGFHEKPASGVSTGVLTGNYGNPPPVYVYKYHLIRADKPGNPGSFLTTLFFDLQPGVIAQMFACK